jgi:hypothetical protein
MVKEYKYVQEFDIKGFFNNVSLLRTVKALLKRGMPHKPLERLFKIAIAAPINMDFQQEDTMKSDYDIELSIRKGIITSDEASLAIREMPHRTSVIVPYLQEWGFSEGDTEEMLKGLPQGAAPSTILSLLALSDWYKDLKKKGIELLMYADDGILFSNEDFEATPPPGFKFAEEKCRWLKWEEDGLQKTVEEGKFLGVVYNFDTNMLRGSTRNGSTLEFGAEQVNLLEYLKEIVPHEHSGDLMTALTSSGIFGQALSKLYGGKFGKLEYEEKQTFKKRSYWDLNHNLKELQEDHTLQRKASTIACGWLLLLNGNLMLKQNRRKFSRDAKRYHNLRKWEITEKDIKDSVKYNTWDET